MYTMGREQQHTLDHDAAELAGIPTLLLMEHAAAAVCRAVRAAAQTVRGPISILTGTGNNGGDGYALARQLRSVGYDVRIYETAAPEAFPEVGDSAINRRAAFGLNIPVCPASLYSAGPGVVVDCVYGTGFRAGRPLQAGLKALFAEVETARLNDGAQVVAVDVPSGVDGDSGLVEDGALRATRTVTFVYPKPGLLSYPGRAYAGEISVETLGIPDDFIQRVYRGLADPGPMAIDGADIRAFRPVRPADGHKGTFGRALLAAGSPGYAGAGILAVRGCLASGAGLVTWMVPDALYAAVAASCPPAVIQPYPADIQDSMNAWIRRLSEQQAVLIGSGCGVNPVAVALTGLAIRHARRLVLDADALTVLAGDSNLTAELKARPLRNLEPAVLTPHPGEFLRLEPDAADFPEGRLTAAEQLAARLNAVVVLKGAGTVAALPKTPGQPGCERALWINTTGNDGMGKGGAGDVLAGLLTGLLAQRLPLRDAVCSAVYLHGLAGDLLRRKTGAQAMRMDQLPNMLGAAFAETGWESGWESGLTVSDADWF